MIMNSAFIEIPCLSGKHGSTQQYVTTISAVALMRLIGGAVTSADENPEIVLNTRFIRSLSKQMEQSDSVISYTPIVVAVLGDIAFSSSLEHLKFGQLCISTLAEFRIIDGLHRMAALIAANLPLSRLSSEYLPVSFVSVADAKHYLTLRRYLARRQDTGRNITSKRVQKNTLLERSKNLILHSFFLQKAIALGKSSLAPRAQQLLPQAAFSRACAPLFDLFDQADDTNVTIRITEYWDYLCKILPPWQDYNNSKITAYEVRNTTVLASTAVLVALGKLGAEVFGRFPDRWQETVCHLSELDWSRNQSTDFEGIALQNGVLLKGALAENQTYELLKTTCNVMT